MNDHPDFLTLQVGVFYHLPDADYRAAPGVSNSMLKSLAMDGAEPGSPAHFIASFQEPKEDTDPLFIGRQVHSRVLTPDAPMPGVIQYPDTYPAPADCSAVKQKRAQPGDPLPWHGAAKYCKEWEEAQAKAGLRPMKAEQILAMDGMVNSIASNPTCKMIFEDGRPEVSLFKPYRNDQGMVLRKARLDWVPPGCALVDIKTCQDARAVDFARVMWARRYYVQAALYKDLYNELMPNDQKTNFVFIAVEKFPPYALQIHNVDEGDLRAGTWEWRRNLDTIIKCMAENNWPAYSPEVQTIKMRVPFGTAAINE